MLSTLRWKLLLPEKFKFRKLFSLYMMGSFFGTFLPGIIGGDAVRAYYLNKDAKKISLIRIFRMVNAIKKGEGEIAFLSWKNEAEPFFKMKKSFTVRVMKD